MQEKEVPEIQKFSSVQFSHEWFGLGFTGVGLPSLARRARVPADSATLLGYTFILPPIQDMRMTPRSMEREEFHHLQ